MNKENSEENIKYLNSPESVRSVKDYDNFNSNTNDNQNSKKNKPFHSNAKEKQINLPKITNISKKKDLNKKDQI